MAETATTAPTTPPTMPPTGTELDEEVDDLVLVVERTVGSVVDGFRKTCGPVVIVFESAFAIKDDYVLGRRCRSSLCISEREVCGHTAGGVEVDTTTAFSATVRLNSQYRSNDKASLEESRRSKRRGVIIGPKLEVRSMVVSNYNGNCLSTLKVCHDQLREIKRAVNNRLDREDMSLRSLFSVDSPIDVRGVVPYNRRRSGCTTAHLGIGECIRERCRGGDVAEDPLLWSPFRTEIFECHVPQEEQSSRTGHRRDQDITTTRVGSF